MPGDSSSSALAPLTTVPPLVEPSAAASLTIRRLSLITAAPVNWFATSRLKVPPPENVNPALPETTPANVRSDEAETYTKLSADKVIAPDNELEPLLTLNVPPLTVIVSAPTVTPRKSSVAPLATVVPPAVSPRPVALVIANVPALTVVVPL